MPLARFEGIVRALKNPNYGTYAAGNSVSLIGTWIQRIAVGWLAWELTGSGAWLGAVAFADLFPAVFIGPFGGAVADRLSRLRIITISQALAMVQAVALFWLTFSGAVTIEWLFALVLVNGFVMGFNQPSRLALVPSLVPREDLSTAVAINAIVFNLARFIGPAVAGLLIVSWGVAAAFAANALSFVAFFIAISRIRLDEAAPGRGGVRRSLLADVGEGIRYTVGHSGIGPMLLLMVVLSLGVRPFVELLPGFADAVFHRGAEALAMLSSTIGIGAVLSGIWLAQRGPRAGLARLTLIAAGCVALAILAFTASDLFSLALLTVALAGIAMVLSGVGAQTLIQLTVEPEMRGRVMSLYGIIFRGGPAAGALVIGTLSEFFGLRWPLAGGAVLALGVWAWIWVRHRRLIYELEAGRERAV
jgi:MFS family permease